MGAHVSACPNEINWRTTPISARGTVAMAGGGFGYELDLLDLPERACEHIKQQIALYHKIEGVVREGSYFRLSGPADEACAWEFVSEDGSMAVVGMVLLLIEGYGAARYVTPRGLTPGAFYCELTTGAVFAADALMDSGFPLPVNAEPYMGRIYRFERL